MRWWLFMLSLLVSIPLLKSPVLESSSLPAGQGGLRMLCPGKCQKGNKKDKPRCRLEHSTGPSSREEVFTLHIPRHPGILLGFSVSGFLSLTHTPLGCLHLPDTQALERWEGHQGTSSSAQIPPHPLPAGAGFTCLSRPFHTCGSTALWDFVGMRAGIAPLSQWPLLASGNLPLSSSVQVCGIALGRVRLMLKPLPLQGCASAGRVPGEVWGCAPSLGLCRTWLHKATAILV